MNLLKKNLLIRIVFHIGLVFGFLFLLNLFLKISVVKLFLLNDEKGRILRFIVSVPFMIFIYNKLNAIRLGFNKSIFKDIFIGMVCGVIMISLVVWVLIWSGQLSLSYQIVTFGGIVYSVICLFFLAYLEEMIFRGIIFRELSSSWGYYKALLVSSIIFGAIHLFNIQGDWIGFVSALLGGILLAKLYDLRKSLFLPVSFHFFWNLTQTFWGLPVSGSNEFSKLLLFNANLTGKNWITGGQSGIENSVLTLLLLIIMILMLHMKRGNNEN